MATELLNDLEALVLRVAQGIVEGDQEHYRALPSEERNSVHLSWESCCIRAHYDFESRMLEVFIERPDGSEPFGGAIHPDQAVEWGWRWPVSMPPARPRREAERNLATDYAQQS